MPWNVFLRFSLSRFIERQYLQVKMKHLTCVFTEGASKHLEGQMKSDPSQKSHLLISKLHVFSHASHVAVGMVVSVRQSVCPSIWSRLIYLNNYNHHHHHHLLRTFQYPSEKVLHTMQQIIQLLQSFNYFRFYDKTDTTNSSNVR